MSRFVSLKLLLFCIAAGSSLLAGEGSLLHLGGLFSDGAVFQRDQPIAIWGTASPGAEVRVQFRSQSTSSKADAGGRWSAKLKPETAGGPDVLKVSSGSESVTVNDVWVGEVWLASGQSNMAFKLSAMEKFQPAAIPDDPQIRIFRVPQIPQDNPKDTLSGAWKPASMEVSAVAYFFGRELREKLKVPVGVITAAVAGTPVAAWISRDGARGAAEGQAAFEAGWQKTLEGIPAAQKKYDEALAKWKETKAQAEASGAAFSDPEPRRPTEAESPKRPYCLFNGMIHPLAPYTMRGVLWYQGESDARREREPYYAKVLRAMIQDWRGRWNAPDLSFLIIQLPVYGDDVDWAELRGAQQTVARDPHNGLVVTLDLGEDKQLHPRNKEPVGKRAANLALADVYDINVPAHSPTAKSARLKDGAVRVSFACDEGATLVCRPEESPQGFEVAGEDGHFVTAQVRRAGNDLVISAREAPKPVWVRYGWAASTPVTLFDSHGLPAPQFSLRVEAP